jgi:hypothetical protein
MLSALHWLLCCRDAALTSSHVHYKQKEKKALYTFLLQNAWEWGEEVCNAECV